MNRPFDRTRAGGVLLGLTLVGLSGCAGPRSAEGRWPAMGGEMSVEIWATTEGTAEELVTRMREAAAEAAAVLDERQADSEVRRLHELAVGEAYVVESLDLYRCTRLALDYAKASGGDFDPTVGALSVLYDAEQEPDPASVEAALASVSWREVVTEREALAIRFRRQGTRIDLGGIASGYALDIAARNFSLPGSRAGLLQLGTHLYAWGRRPGDATWTLTVPDPREASVAFGEIDVQTRGVAAAAASREGRRPTLDPRSGLPSGTDVQVAVGLADSAADADAISTALVVSGSLRAGKFLDATHRVEAILLVQEGDAEPYLLVSASLRGKFRPSPSLAAQIGDRVRYLLPPASLGERPTEAPRRSGGLLDDAGVR